MPMKVEFYLSSSALRQAPEAVAAYARVHGYGGVEWYLDLRRYGTVPHGGFGMGIERVVAWICGLEHVRETIPYPRMLYRIYP